MPALTAIGCSTVNSYRRLWDTGFWAPVYADWGYQNRTCGLRVSAPGRFEYRAVDSAVNPYLMGSTVLAAFDDGLKNKMDPGEPESRNIYEAMKQGKAVKKLPLTLAMLWSGCRKTMWSRALCRMKCIGFSCTISETSGRNSWPPSPIGTWKLIGIVCLNNNRKDIKMCGISGLIHRDGSADIGSEMTRMLQSLRHRGPDSTGYALYGEGEADVHVMRVKYAEQDDLAAVLTFIGKLKSAKPSYKSVWPKKALSC